MSRIKELEILLDESPDDPFIIYALAREHEKLSSTLQAILMYEYLVNSHPAYIATYYHYAKLLYEAGNRNQGLALLKQGIENGVKEKDMHAVGEMKGLMAQWTDNDDV
ncbi:MAG: tetratricopeptide repeat protein [Saprospiraceae bacterium]